MHACSRCRTSIARDRGIEHIEIDVCCTDNDPCPRRRHPAPLLVFILSPVCAHTSAGFRHRTNRNVRGLPTGELPLSRLVAAHISKRSSSSEHLSPPCDRILCLLGWRFLPPFMLSAYRCLGSWNSPHAPSTDSIPSVRSWYDSGVESQIALR